MELSKLLQPPDSSSSSFGFLDLPLEIRNEIYSYVLTNIPIPYSRNRFRPPGMQHWRYPEPDSYTNATPQLQLPSLASSSSNRQSNTPSRQLKFVGSNNGAGKSQTKLALLRVNRQVHDEAAVVFYGGNVFKIEVSIGKRTRVRPIGAGRPRYQSVYDIYYTAPWEHLRYQFIEDEDGTTEGIFVHPPDSFYNEREDTKLFPEYLQPLQNNANVLLYPSSTYSPLVRRTHLHCRVQESLRKPSSLLNARGSSIGDDITTTSTYSLLLPFLWRLRQQLTEKATMEIELETKASLSLLGGHNQIRDNLQGIDEFMEDSLEVGYLLSRGPWKSIFKNLSPGLYDMRERVFGDCEKRPEFREEEIERMMRELDVGLFEGTFWGVREGVLTVFYPASETPVPPVIPPALLPFNSSDY
ncbi:hypothetical protein TWF506_005920 [Arthrobotrys conoides]|uniref:F-box domain-containing protein n=1 Tax=Arthrobotrys conoides TaxID=74498 RepID=A0AAN8RWA9_9PEZI